MMSSLPVEATPRVSLLGAPGAFHDLACDYFSPQLDEERRVRCAGFLEIVQRLESGEVDQAVIAVANSEIGTLPDAYGVLAAHNTSVVGEVYLRIRHNLLVLPEVETIDEITSVHSNPKAFGQCDTFLSRLLAHAARSEGSDTATCAQQIAEQGDPSQAAIASRQAAERYGLKVMHAGIQTNPDNQTRFWLLERGPREIAKADKTSLIVATANRAGSLHEVLGAWATRAINLSSIHSHLKPQQIHSPWGAYLHAHGADQLVEQLRDRRPEGTWDVHFDIDVAAGLQDPVMQAALGELGQQVGVELRVLGSYRQGELIG